MAGGFEPGRQKSSHFGAMLVLLLALLGLSGAYDNGVARLPPMVCTISDFASA